MSPIKSCEGLGVPVYFYLEFVWLCSMVTGSTIFFLSANLSESILGGLVAIASFFFNHVECTRVQWTPPLRESFAYPALLLQIFMISEILKKNKQPRTTSANVVCTIFFLELRS